MEKVCYRNLDRESNIGHRSFDPGRSPLRQAPLSTEIDFLESIKGIIKKL